MKSKYRYLDNKVGNHNKAGYSNVTSPADLVLDAVLDKKFTSPVLSDLSLSVKGAKASPGRHLGEAYDYEPSSRANSKDSKGNRLLKPAWNANTKVNKHGTA